MTETIVLGVVASVIAALVIWGVQRMWARWRRAPHLPPARELRGADGLDALAQEGAQRLLAEAMRREIERRASGRS